MGGWVDVWIRELVSGCRIRPWIFGIYSIFIYQSGVFGGTGSSNGNIM